MLVTKRLDRAAHRLPAGPPKIAQDTNMISTLAVIGVIVGAISGLASLALLLLFLWRVYDRGGQTDLVAAAKALRQVRDPASRRGR